MSAGYFTDVGPKSSPIPWCDSRGAIGVLEVRDHHTPIGRALETGWDEAGRSLWRRTVQGAEPGVWAVVDRESRPARDDRPDRYRQGRPGSGSPPVNCLGGTCGAAVHPPASGG